MPAVTPSGGGSRVHLEDAPLRISVMQTAARAESTAAQAPAAIAQPVGGARDLAAAMTGQLTEWKGEVAAALAQIGVSGAAVNAAAAGAAAGLAMADDANAATVASADTEVAL